MQKNLKTIGAYTESNDLIFKIFKKNYSSRDTVPLNKQETLKNCSLIWIIKFSFLFYL